MLHCQDVEADCLDVLIIFSTGIYRKTPNKRPPPINAPPYTPDPILVRFLTFLAISRLKMVRFSFRKKLLEGENALFKPAMPANAHGRLLGVLR